MQSLNWLVEGIKIKLPNSRQFLIYLSKYPTNLAWLYGLNSKNAVETFSKKVIGGISLQMHFIERLEFENNLFNNDKMTYVSNF